MNRQTSADPLVVGGCDEDPFAHLGGAPEVRLEKVRREDRRSIGDPVALTLERLDDDAPSSCAAPRAIAYVLQHKDVRVMPPDD